MRYLVPCLFALLALPSPSRAERLLAVLGGAAFEPVAENAGGVVEVLADGSTSLLAIPLPGEDLLGLATLPDGRLFAVTGQLTGPARLLELDPVDGTILRDVGELRTASREEEEEEEEKRTEAARRAATVGAEPGHRPAAGRNATNIHADSRGEGELIPVSFHDLAAHPSTGELYGVAESSSQIREDELFVIDPATAIAYPRSLPETLRAPQAIVGRSGHLAISFTPTGELWGKEINAPGLFRLDPATGAVLETRDTTPQLGALGMGNTGPNSFVLSACCAPAGLAPIANDGSEIYHLDASGQATAVGSPASRQRIEDFALLAAAPTAPEIPTLEGVGAGVLALLLVAFGWRRLGRAA